MKKTNESSKGVSVMYESYPWPGACSIKGEVELFTKWVQELFVGVLKEIKNNEK